MSGRTIFGTLLIVIGAGFLLGQMGVWDFGSIFGTWWPLILIFIGAVQLIGRSAPLIGAAILVVVGLIFQGLNLGIFPGNTWALVWSALLIVAGLWLLFARGFHAPEDASSEDMVQVFAIFGASNPRNQSKAFQGGTVTTFFAGSDVDLRDAKLAPGGARLEVTTAFGGAKIIVPEDWRVEVTGLPIFGGWSNKARQAPVEGMAAKLHVSCFALFGGIDVVN
jgi:predicted membrane protein